MISLFDSQVGVGFETRTDVFPMNLMFQKLNRWVSPWLRWRPPSWLLILLAILALILVPRILLAATLLWLIVEVFVTAFAIQQLFHFRKSRTK